MSVLPNHNEIVRPSKQDLAALARIPYGIIPGQYIEELIDRRIIQHPTKSRQDLLKQVNATSLDVTLGEEILTECNSGVSSLGYRLQTVSLRDRESPKYAKKIMTETSPHVLGPGEFILACTKEIFFLPSHISAKFMLKSSVARMGIDHLKAGWCDATWENAVVTLELRNVLTYHGVEMRPDDRIGQLVFFCHEAVYECYHYSQKGSYNGDRSVSAPKPKEPTKIVGFEQSNHIIKAKE